METPLRGARDDWEIPAICADIDHRIDAESTEQGPQVRGPDKVLHICVAINKFEADPMQQATDSARTQLPHHHRGSCPAIGPG